MTYGVFATGTEDYGSTPTWGVGSTRPAVFVEVAFTTDPASAAPAWIDVGERLKLATVHRGRPDELAAFSAGQATLTLNNEDRAFDPTYTSSPYYPNVVPMRRIRIRAVYAGVTYSVFTGYVTNWRQVYRHPSDADVVIDATDAFKVLSNVSLPGSVYEREVLVDSPSHWWRLGEPSGSTVAFDRVLTAPKNGTYMGGATGQGASGAPTHDPNTAVAFDGTDDYVTFGPPLVTSFPYTLEVWLKIATRGSPGDYVFFAQAGGAATQAPWGKVSGTDLGDPGKVRWDNLFSTSRVDDNAWHHVVLTADSGGGQTLYIDGQAQATGTATTPGVGSTDMFIGHPGNYAFVAVSRFYWPGSLDEFAIYPTALTAARVAAHNDAARTPWRNDLTGTRVGRVLDAAGWPAADRNVDAGFGTLQSADLGTTALAALQATEQTEFGALFITGDGKVRFVARDSLLKAPYATAQAVFGDSGTELEFGDLTFEYDDDLIFNEAQVSRSNGVVQVAGDPTSQARYLKRTKVVSGLLHTSDQTSLDAANWILGHYKNPLLRVTGMRLEPSAGNESTHYPQVLGRELLDRVTINRRPQNLGAAITQDSQIQGMTHTVTPKEWVTHWDLSPAETQVYWILGVAGQSELGVTTRLGF